MKATATYLGPVSAVLMETLGPGKIIITEKNPPVMRADQGKGDGGVDVTGAPKSRPVEGAGFGRLFSFSSSKWSLLIKSSLMAYSRTLGGSNF